MKYFYFKFIFAIFLNTSLTNVSFAAEPPNYDQQKDFFLAKSEIVRRLGAEYRGNNFRFSQESLDREVRQAEYLYSQPNQLNPYQYPGLSNLFYKRSDLVNYTYSKYLDHNSWVLYTEKFLKRFNVNDYKLHLNFSGIPFSQIFPKLLEHEKIERDKWLGIYEEVRQNADNYLLKGPFHPHKITGVDKLHRKGLDGEGAEIIVWDCGFVDNCHVSFNSNSNDQIKYPEQRDTFDDDDIHGTHVSGIIAADAASRTKRGVAYNASIVPIKYRGIPDLITRIKDEKAKIISASFDYLLHRTQIVELNQLVEELEKNDRLLVLAAGNDSKFLTADMMPGFYQYWYRGGWFESIAARISQINPEFFKRILFVGSLKEDGTTVSSFSNLPGVFATNFVFAPGENVLATVAYDKFDTMSGTSMATPHVSGILALLSKYHPDLNGIQLKQCITGTCDQFWQEGTHVLGRNYNPSVHGLGRVNAVEAFKAAKMLTLQEQKTSMDVA